MYADHLAAQIYGYGMLLLISAEWSYLLTSARRDNCPCEQCLNPQTRQRQHDSFEVRSTSHPVSVWSAVLHLQIPLDIAIVNLSEESHGVRIRCE